MRCVMFGLLLLGSACASPAIPPGGPEDEDPPAIVRIRPDTNAVNVRSGRVGFDFDEVISERPQGAPNLAELFVISPSKGVNELSWRRTRLEVAPRGGLRPNTTYRVTMLPGLVDLDGNMDSVGATVVFSTGPALAQGRISGRVFDWLEERPARQALVEAIVLPDSLRYLAIADSLGAFELRNMPPGTYVLRAIADQNKNRALDVRELYDTSTVALTDSARRVLHAIVRDTLGPAIERVEVVDSLTLRVRFDKALDTTMVIDSTLLSLKRADSTRVPLRRTLGSRAFKRLEEDSIRQKAIQDSVRAANDTTGRGADTGRTPADAAAAARAAATRAVAPRPGAARARPTGPAGRGAPPRDTTPPPKPTVRIPENEVMVKLVSPLPYNMSFRMRVEDARSVVGRVRSSERTFNTPRRTRAELQRDSLRADSLRRDSVKRDSVRRDSARRDTVGVGGPPHRENEGIPQNLRHLLVPTRTNFPQTR